MRKHDWFGPPIKSYTLNEGDPGVRAYAYLAVSSVPKHNAVANDFVKKHSADDDERAAIVLEEFPGDVNAWVLVRNKLRAWLRYWAVKHPTAEGRARCIAALKEGDGLIERARDHLRRQGLDPVTGEPTA
jgi:hypothetical protein